MKKAIIHVGVWDDWHSNIFSKVGIPNIKSLVKEIPIPYEIIIQTETKQIPKFKGLDAEFIPFFDGKKNHHRRSEGISPIIKKAYTEDAAILWWPPDQLYSKGVFKTAFEKLEEGFRMIMQPSFRLNDVEDIPKNPTPKKLVKFALNNMHQMQKACNWSRFGEKVYACQQPCLYSKVNETSMVIKGFQGYIIAIYPTKYKPCDLTQGQDGDLTQQLIDDVEQIYVPQDSDEGFCVDFSPKDRFHPHINKGKTKEDRLRYWASLHLNKAHLYMLLQTMIVHSGKITPKLLEAKEKLEKETHYVIEPIFHAKNLKYKEIPNVAKFGSERLYVCFVLLNDVDAIDFCNKRITELIGALKDILNYRVVVYVSNHVKGRVRHTITNYSLKNVDIRDVFMNKPKEALIPECRLQVEHEAKDAKSTAFFLLAKNEIKRDEFKV